MHLHATLVDAISQLAATSNARLFTVSCDVHSPVLFCAHSSSQGCVPYTSLWRAVACTAPTAPTGAGTNIWSRAEHRHAVPCGERCKAAVEVVVATASTEQIPGVICSGSEISASPMMSIHKPIDRPRVVIQNMHVHKRCQRCQAWQQHAVAAAATPCPPRCVFMANSPLTMQSGTSLLPTSSAHTHASSTSSTVCDNQAYIDHEITRSCANFGHPRMHMQLKCPSQQAAFNTTQQTAKTAHQHTQCVHMWAAIETSRVP